MKLAVISNSTILFVGAFNANLHNLGDKLICIYSQDPGQLGEQVEVKFIAGRAVVLIEVPTAGLVIFE